MQKRKSLFPKIPLKIPPMFFHVYMRAVRKPHPFCQQQCLLFGKSGSEAAGMVDHAVAGVGAVKFGAA